MDKRWPGTGFAVVLVTIGAIYFEELIGLTLLSIVGTTS